MVENDTSMTSIHELRNENKLVSNKEKTRTMIKGLRQRLATIGNTNILHIKIGNTSLQNVDWFEKLLLVTIDGNLIVMASIGLPFKHVCKTVSETLANLLRAV